VNSKFAIDRLITKNIAFNMENKKIFLKPINVQEIVLISVIHLLLFSFPEICTDISQKYFFIHVLDFKVLIIHIIFTSNVI